METTVSSVTKILKNMLHGLPMGKTRGVHELTNLANSEGEIWTGEREVLETPNQAATESEIIK